MFVLNKNYMYIYIVNPRVTHPNFKSLTWFRQEGSATMMDGMVATGFSFSQPFSG
jgi:hypothetical protein